MIKKLKIELVFLGLLIINFFFSSRIDIIFYDKFNNYYNFWDDIYIKQFFINITEIGDSLWFFSLSFLIYFLCYFFKDIVLEKHKKIYDKVQIGSLFLFTAILITGIFTQIIKHVVGRPRPNHILEHGYFGFDFFNLSSAFHSFPSGHTSTIFIVALTFSIFTPKLKYFYICCASIVALSRVVVGAHFFTDIIGGIVIAFIGFKITFAIFEKLKKNQNLSLIKKLNSNIFLLSIIVFIILIILVSVGGIDIYISSLFYQEQQSFLLQDYHLITIIVRKIILPLLVVYLLIIPTISFFLPINKIYFNFKITLKEILFVFLSVLFNLLIVVNIILKNLWGRARPNDILELGGGGIFTPWFHFSDACNTNCSFVSGDASVGFSIIALFFITKNKIFFWMALCFGCLIGATRILEGGHFFSDVLIAGFLIFILTYFQHYFYLKKFLNND